MKTLLIALGLSLSIVVPLTAQAETVCGSTSWSDYEITTEFEGELCSEINDYEDEIDASWDRESALEDRVDELEAALRVRERLLTVKLNGLLSQLKTANAQIKALKRSKSRR